MDKRVEEKLEIFIYALEKNSRDPGIPAYKTFIQTMTDYWDALSKNIFHSGKPYATGGTVGDNNTETVKPSVTFQSKFTEEMIRNHFNPPPSSANGKPAPMPFPTSSEAYALEQELKAPFPTFEEQVKKRDGKFPSFADIQAQLVKAGVVVHSQSMHGFFEGYLSPLKIISYNDLRRYLYHTNKEINAQEVYMYFKEVYAPAIMVDPAADPTTASLLLELCIALGWQGGTREQALDEVRRIKNAPYLLSKLCAALGWQGGSPEAALAEVARLQRMHREEVVEYTKDLYRGKRVSEMDIEELRNAVHKLGKVCMACTGRDTHA